MKEYLFGKRSFEECLKSEYKIEEVLIADNLKEIEHFKKCCVKNNIRYSIIKKFKLDELTKTSKNNGIAFRIKSVRYYEMDDILGYCEREGRKAFLVILDCLEDPRNFGAIIRSADAAGVHGIIFPEDRSTDITSYVIRTSSGAFFHQKLCRVKNIARTVDYLKKHNIWIFGLSEKAEKTIFEENLNCPLAVVVGAEERGIRHLVQKKCDFMVKIPMLGKIESLNASVSASIVFYEVIRQRNLGV